MLVIPFSPLLHYSPWRKLDQASDSQNVQCRSQKALDMSQLWKVFMGHDNSGLWYESNIETFVRGKIAASGYPNLSLLIMTG